jgi:glucose-1-phosphate thymidylyltransferase
MKGIILAGGAGTRLSPLTSVVSKQLLPVYDKPMIYYPLSVLMLARVREILIISTPQDLPLFERLLGSGTPLGLSLSYAAQPMPNGLAEAFLIGRDFIGADSVCLVLGDNIFYGDGLTQMVQEAVSIERGCVLFGYQVNDPERYGVVELGPGGKVIGVEEKPIHPKSRYAVTGLYFYDNQVLDLATRLRPSARGELEITDINRIYIERGEARVELLGRGMAWLDTGTHTSLLEAAHFVHVLQERQGTHIACIEEIAFRMGYIDAEALRALGRAHGKSPYAEYLLECAAGGRTPAG